MWLGNLGAPEVGDAYRSLYKVASNDAFATPGTWWSYPRAESDYVDDVSGPNRPAQPWWKTQDGTYGIPGRPTAIVSDIAISPGSPNEMLVTGQVGIFQSHDGGAHWYPSVRGLMNAVVRQVLTDPRHPDHVYVGDVNFRGFASADRLRSLRAFHTNVKNNVSQDGWALALDTATDPATVYVGTGDRDTNTGGQVWVNLDPAGTGTWTQVGPDFGKRPTALAVMRSGGTPVVIAAVQEDGIYRKIGRGPWTKTVATAAGGDQPMVRQNTNQATLAALPNTSTVYLFDRNSGLWRSDNVGGHWIRILRDTRDAELSGYVAVDPGDANSAYVSLSTGLFRVTNARGAGPDGATTVKLAVNDPGALTISPSGTMYVVARDCRGAPRLYAGDVRTASPRFTDISDDAFRNAAVRVTSIAAASDGHLYAGLQQNGVLTRGN